MTESVMSWIRSEENPATLEHSARTAVAAVVSLLVARRLGMPEAYWAPISALIVMQSTLGDALRTSAQRFAGTALGAFVAALISMRYRDNALAFGLAILAIGVLCAGGRIERAAYRYASITLAIVMLVVHRESGWIIALHRFIEVSTGIAVGLAVTAVWPEHRTKVRASA
jgi:uncharacterized membrane protein YgaE (UPF0421/DUF939 family)